MPSKNTNKRKTNKKLKMNLKNVKNLIPKCDKILNSSLLLFVIAIATVVNLFYLWTNQDNESLFLFVLIAFIVYTQDRKKNMIIVLGIPFVVVNLLIGARKMFRNEGFEDLSGACASIIDATDVSECQTLMSNSNSEDLIAWVKGDGDSDFIARDLPGDTDFKKKIMSIHGTDISNVEYITNNINIDIEAGKTNTSNNAPASFFKKYFEFLKSKLTGDATGGDDSTGGDGGATGDMDETT